MKALSSSWLSATVVLIVLGVVVMSSGCGSSAPPTAPEVIEEPTEEYIQGEEAYSKEG